MKFTKKWMVVPYTEPIKDKLTEALTSSCKLDRMNEYNDILLNTKEPVKSTVLLPNIPYNNNQETTTISNQIKPEIVLKRDIEALNQTSNRLSAIPRPSTPKVEIISSTPQARTSSTPRPSCIPKPTFYQESPSKDLSSLYQNLFESFQENNIEIPESQREALINSFVQKPFFNLYASEATRSKQSYPTVYTKRIRQIIDNNKPKRINKKITKRSHNTIDKRGVSKLELKPKTNPNIKTGQSLKSKVYPSKFNSKLNPNQYKNLVQTNEQMLLDENDEMQLDESNNSNQMLASPSQSFKEKNWITIRK